MEKIIFCFFVLLLISSGKGFSQGQGETFNKINPVEFKELISQQNSDIIILDVRTPGEFKEGHIENSVNIDLLGNDFKDNISKLDNSKTYLVYCKLGGRSSKASNILNDLGFRNVYNLNGGITDWIAKGYPIVK